MNERELGKCSLACRASHAALDQHAQRPAVHPESVVVGGSARSPVENRRAFQSASNEGPPRRAAESRSAQPTEAWWRGVERGSEEQQCGVTAVQQAAEVPCAPPARRRWWRRKVRRRPRCSEMRGCALVNVYRVDNAVATEVCRTAVPSSVVKCRNHPERQRANAHVNIREIRVTGSPFTAPCPPDVRHENSSERQRGHRRVGSGPPRHGGEICGVVCGV